MDIQIRPALPEEAERLSQVAFASKAYWGYPKHWMELWKPQLTFGPQYFEENESWVAAVDDRPIAFYTLQEKNGIAWLENLFALPEFIGQGIGRSLFLHAVELLRQRGHKILQLEADPNAVGFYVRMGMHQVGERRYEMEGQQRSLPLMEMKM